MAEALPRGGWGVGGGGWGGGAGVAMGVREQCLCECHILLRWGLSLALRKNHLDWDLQEKLGVHIFADAQRHRLLQDDVLEARYGVAEEEGIDHKTREQHLCGRAPFSRPVIIHREAVPHDDALDHLASHRELVSSRV